MLSALLEYALILLLLKKRRKPKSPWTIEGGLKSVSVYEFMTVDKMAGEKTGKHQILQFLL